MPKLMVDFITSLDGYGAAEGWPGFWGMEGPEYLGRLAEEEEHTIPMGATTYRLMAGNGRDGRRVRKPGGSSRLRRVERDAEGGVLLHAGGAPCRGRTRNWSPAMRPRPCVP